MNRPTPKNYSRYEFRFDKGLNFPELQNKANLKLVQILALVPPDAVALGALEKDQNYYLASIELKSNYKTFLELAAGTTPDNAVKKVFDKIEDRIYRWRSGSNLQTPEI